MIAIKTMKYSFDRPDCERPPVYVCMMAPVPLSPARPPGQGCLKVQAVVTSDSWNTRSARCFVSAFVSVFFIEKVATHKTPVRSQSTVDTAKPWRSSVF